MNPATVVTCSSSKDSTCSKNACVPATGKCAMNPQPDGLACSDLNTCTPPDVCKAGVCKSGGSACQCQKNSDCALFEDGISCNGTLYCDSDVHQCLVNPATVKTCPSPTPSPTPVPVCGDQKCTPGENLVNCGKDCPAAACGNLVCEPAENPKNCPLDCGGSCGDGKCTWGEGANCPFDCGNACGNGVCQKGENPDNCPTDCKWKACGNGQCEGGENPQLCPEDCSKPCGNGICEKGEDYKACPADCGYCGDGVCSILQANGMAMENDKTCPKDCAFSKLTAAPSCGNTFCDLGENAGTCPADCTKPSCGDGACSTQESASSCPKDGAKPGATATCARDLKEGCSMTAASCA